MGSTEQLRFGEVLAKASQAELVKVRHYRQL